MALAVPSTFLNMNAYRFFDTCPAKTTLRFSRTPDLPLVTWFQSICCLIKPIPEGRAERSTNSPPDRQRLVSTQPHGICARVSEPR